MEACFSVTKNLSEQTKFNFALKVNIKYAHFNHETKYSLLCCEMVSQSKCNASYPAIATTSTNVIVIYVTVLVQ